MKLLRKKLNARGFSHILIPLIVIVGVAVFGTFYIVLTHAATPSGSIQFNDGVNNFCLDNFHSGAVDYNKVDVWGCNKSKAQSWTAASATSSKTGGAITNASGLCLDVYHSGLVTGTKVDVFKCNKTGAQSWYINGATIVNPHSNLCLTDTGSSATDGTQVTVAGCNKSKAQSWTAAAIGAPAPPPSTGGGGGSGGPVGGGTGSGSGTLPTGPCAPSWQTISVSGVQWVRTSNNWGGANVCLNTWDGSTASYIVQSQSAKPSGGVMAYPDLSQGCGNGGGYCTTNWTSKQVSALTDPRVTWVTSQAGAVSGSKYDTGADLWFSSTPDFKTNGAEIFIALNNQGEPPSTSKQVTISGVAYYFYIVPQKSWNEIIFAPVKPVSSVTNFALLPFFQYVVNQNLMPASDYWVNASFGNEIWQAGSGLETTSLSLTE